MQHVKKAALILALVAITACGIETTPLKDTAPIGTSDEALTEHAGSVGAVSVGGARTFVTRNNTVIFTKPFGAQTTSKIYAAGDRNFGSLGDGCTTGCGSAPTPEVIFTEVCPISTPCVVDVKSGSGHTLILDYLGNVYHFGNSFHGEACKVDVAPAISDPTPTLIGNSTDKIAAGANGSWFHSTAGGWYYCGINDLGEGGFAQGDVMTPKLGGRLPQAPGGFDWTDIAGGDQHTLFRVGQNVYAQGSNEEGQSGSGDPARLSGIICGFDMGSQVIISAGAHTSMCAGTASGQASVWTWGDNSDGELGDGTAAGSRSAPVRVLAVDFLDSARESAFGHTISVMYHNSGGAAHYACAGDNRSSQCGVSTVAFPTVTNFIRGDTILTDGLATPMRIWADGGGDVIRVDSAHVRTLGNNDFGQLGIGFQGGPQTAWQSTTGF